AGENFEEGSEPALGLLSGYKPLPPSSDITYGIADEDIPESFDSRVQWPDCDTIKEIGNKGCCRSDWAISATGVISDRICIASMGTQQVEVSAQDVIACIGFRVGGCGGGQPSSVFNYYIETGVVTGGQVDRHKGCQPWSIFGGAMCNLTINTPRCQRECKTAYGYNLTYTQDKHFGSKTYGVSVGNVQKEIMTNGPVSATFALYEDFYLYKSGVYQHVTGKYVGGHAVKLIGWGVDNGVDYWLVANSWYTDFGEQGFFRIKRGNDECGFERGFDAVTPKLE
ncbi:unnamed protein product, partial [Oppiella nova]